jgi:hypothetical protein
MAAPAHVADLTKRVLCADALLVEESFGLPVTTAYNTAVPAVCVALRKTQHGMLKHDLSATSTGVASPLLAWLGEAAVPSSC